MGADRNFREIKNNKRRKSGYEEGRGVGEEDKDGTAEKQQTHTGREVEPRKKAAKKFEGVRCKKPWKDKRRQRDGQESRRRTDEGVQ